MYILSSVQWHMSSVMSGVYCLLSRVWYVNCSCLLSIVHIVLTFGKCDKSTLSVQRLVPVKPNVYFSMCSTYCLYCPCLV